MGPVGGNHELKATARDDRGPLHRSHLPREGVWDGSRKRTAAPNLSEPSSRLPAWASVPGNTTPSIRWWPGSREGGGGGMLLNLTPGDLFRSGDGRSREGNDEWPTPGEKSDCPIVALKRSNSRGAKGMTSCHRLNIAN